MRFIALAILIASSVGWADPLSVISPPQAQLCADAASALDLPQHNAAIERFHGLLRQLQPGVKVEPLPGAPPWVMKVTFPTGEVYVAKSVRELDTYERRALEHEYELLKALASAHFVPVSHSYDMGGKNDVPFFLMRYYPAGSLGANLSKLGSRVPAEKMIELFEKAAMPMAILHLAKSGSGDVKPANFLVETNGSEVENIVMSDLGAAPGATGDGSRFTADYLDPENLPTNENWKRFSQSIPARDVYAMKVTFQEMLLGRTLGDVAPRYTREASFRYGPVRYNAYGSPEQAELTNISLEFSPHSVDARIHPVLSALAWVDFTNSPAFQKAISEAKTAITTGDSSRFYRDTVMPELRRLGADAAAKKIAYSDELYAAFEKGELGLSSWRSFDSQVKRQISKFRREAALRR